MKEFRIVSTEELFNIIKKELTTHKKYLDVHHTWKPSHKSFKGSNYQSVMYGMWNYHVNTKGWSDIAQHLTLFPDGKWGIGRDFNRNPVSIKEMNQYNFMIEMIGNFDKEGTGSYNSLGYDKFEGKQKEEMLKFCNWFLKEYNVDIRFHNEYSSKTCPGNTINKEQFVKEVKEYNSLEQWKINLVQECLDEGILTSESWLDRAGEEWLWVSCAMNLNTLKIMRKELEKND